MICWHEVIAVIRRFRPGRMRNLPTTHHCSERRKTPPFISITRDPCNWFSCSCSAAQFKMQSEEDVVGQPHHQYDGYLTLDLPHFILCTSPPWFSIRPNLGRLLSLSILDTTTSPLTLFIYLFFASLLFLTVFLIIFTGHTRVEEERRGEAVFSVCWLNGFPAGE